MDIFESTRGYEKWMARHIQIVRADLAFKHTVMAQSVFSFFRGTYYRWVQLIAEMGGRSTPQVFGVGDLHVENFGTWRDTEGRLIWGVNDFDEAYPQPYFLDLLRLAASAHVATYAEHLEIRPRRASELIWEGYTQTLKEGGRPFTLEENNTFLRNAALGELRDPVRFWTRIQQLPDCGKTLPVQAKRALIESLPAADLPTRFKSRRSGVGSLGRPRFVALAEWRGSLVAREAKAVLPSAYAWARGSDTQDTWIARIVKTAVRIPDPFAHIENGWIIRRLSPHCSRIELSSLSQGRDEERLLHAMGCETANIHLGSRRAIKSIVRDVDKRPARFLHRAAKEIVGTTMRDWMAWESGRL